MSWLDALQRAERLGTASVLVTLESVDGSAPRGVGTRLLLAADGATGTLGGGALEQAALKRAERLLRAAAIDPVIEHETWTLGRALSQCCGGRATLSFAYTPACDLRIEIFGAGHVAQEIARLVRRLPCVATFHDPRTAWLGRLGVDEWRPGARHASPHVDRAAVALLPDIELGGQAASEPGPGHLIAAPLGADVHGAVERCAPGAFYLVLTHSHELDLEVCEAVLSRDDAALLGLIASRSKAARFRSRLSAKGFTPAEVARLQAPLGEHVLTGDTPMEVAIAALGDVLTARARRRLAQDTTATPEKHDGARQADA